MPIPVSLASFRVNNTAAQPIPVNFAGTVAPVLGVVTIDNTDGEAMPTTQKTGTVFTVREQLPPTVLNLAPIIVGPDSWPPAARGAAHGSAMSATVL